MTFPAKMVKSTSIMMPSINSPGTATLGRVMPVIPKDSLDWLRFFRQQIDEIFNHLSVIERKDNSGEQAYTPQVDIYETADMFIVELDVPGFDRNHLSLSICCNTMVIEGLKQEEGRGKDVNYICLERCFGRFCKTVEVPPDVNIDKVEAKYDKGVLTVMFPLLKDKNIIVRNIPIA